MSASHRRKPLAGDLLRHVRHGKRDRQHAQSRTVRPGYAIQVRAEPGSLFFEMLLEYTFAAPVHS